MGIFSKKKNNDFFEMIEESLIKEDNDITLPSLPKAPHALTPNEVLSNLDNSVASTTQPGTVNPLESLKSRMKSARESSEQTFIPNTEKVKNPESTDVVSEKPEIVNPDSESNHPSSGHSLASTPQVGENSLLERCKAYTTDANGHDAAENGEPLYKLESVAEILRSQNEKALDEISKKFQVTFDSLDKSVPKDEPDEPQNEIPTEKDSSEPPKPEIIPKSKTLSDRTEAFSKMVSDALEKKTMPDFVDDDYSSAHQVHNQKVSLPNISDIDTQVVPIPDAPEKMCDTATIKFTPVTDKQSGTGSIKISSMTKPIDINEEFFDDAAENADSAESQTVLEQTEFEQYSPKEEYTEYSQTKTFVKKLSVKKRNSFISSLISGVSLLIMIVFLIPSLNDINLSNPRMATIIYSFVFALAFFANISMFAGFKKIFTKKCTADVPAALASIATIGYIITAAFVNTSSYELIFFCTIILFVRAACKFLAASAKLLSFKQISNSHPKKAVVLIADSATTYAMAKDSTEGDALITAPKNTGFIDDFIKYWDYGTVLNGKLGTISIVSAVVAAVCGIIAAAYFDGIIFGFFTFAAFLCFTSLPVIFMLDALPLFSASKKLALKGAMIAGKTAAEKLEMANASVISSTDIFPDGTITLQDMKVLSESSIDDVIVSAASLTEAVNSPLCPIFKKIAGTDKSYALPDSDTVKYEERLGLSGWVGNKLLFIGNRTLMESHGIEVPSVEVDRHILRRGFFPVYLAVGNKACALISVRYDVDESVAKELHTVTRLGVTLLIRNSDPNISKEMLCDYFGLYDDSIKVMDNAGVHMYKSATKRTERCSAPAAFRSSPITSISIINCASRIKGSNTLLSVAYALFSCFGLLWFIYSSFAGSDSNPYNAMPLLYGAGATIASFIAYLFKKP